MHDIDDRIFNIDVNDTDFVLFDLCSFYSVANLNA